MEQHSARPRPQSAVPAGGIMWRSSGASSANRSTASRWPFVGAPCVFAKVSSCVDRGRGEAVRLLPDRRSGATCGRRARPAPRRCGRDRRRGRLTRGRDPARPPCPDRRSRDPVRVRATHRTRAPLALRALLRDWILEVDDDEVLSGSFLGPGSRSDPRIRATGSTGSRATGSSRTPTHWLDEPPWSFDSNRLVRNDPTTLWAAGLSHTRADPAFPSSYLEQGFYHLAYLLTDESQRREKVAHYLGIADVHRIPSTDRDMAELLHAGRSAGTRPVSVPRADRKAIAAVLEATGLDCRRRPRSTCLSPTGRRSMLTGRSGPCPRRRTRRSSRSSTGSSVSLRVSIVRFT